MMKSACHTGVFYANAYKKRITFSVILFHKEKLFLLFAYITSSSLVIIPHSGRHNAFLA